MSALARDTRWLDATEQARLVADRHVTAEELLAASIERIDELNPVLNAVVMPWFDQARAAIAAGLPDGPLRGVPFALKDLAAPYAGMPMASGNRRLRELGVPAAHDSTLTARCRGAGLITLGRTNTSEFGALAGTEPAAWGPTRNPWDTSLSPGGSSGGSAAAVAAGMVPMAHGSDASGSIRIPASCCGLVGLKPSQGRISAGPIHDETGPGVGFCLTRTVRDAALMLDALHGPGIGDTVMTAPPTRPYRCEPDDHPARLVIGVLDRDPAGSPIAEECRAAVRRTAAALETLGHHIDQDAPAGLARLDLLRQASAAQWADLAARVADVAAALGRDLVADDLEPVSWDRVERGRRVPAVEYVHARQAAAQYRREIQRWWHEGHDLLITPTLPKPPGAVGEMSGADPAASERSRHLVTFTKPFNLTGQPAISLPVHRTADGVPIGVQVVAAYGREDLLLRVAAQLERALPWAGRHPPDSTSIPTGRQPDHDERNLS